MICNYVNESQRGKTRRGSTAERVIESSCNGSTVCVAFHTQDLEIITNNDRAEAYSIGSPTFSKMVECGLLVVGHKKPPTLPGGK